MDDVPQRFFGPTARQQLALVLALPVGAVVGAASGAPLVGSVDWLSVVGALLGGLLASALLAPVVRRQGMTVSPYGVEVRRGWSRRRVSWADVRDVQVHRGMWGSTSVRLHTTTGTLRTGQPSSYLLGRDPAFDDKLAGIRSWWLVYRAPAGAPRPEAPGDSR